MGWKGLQSRSLLDEGYAMLSSLYASFFVALISCTGTSCHRRVSGVNEFLDFGDKTEEAGLNFIYSLMQDIKFLKQQFQQQDLHLLERLAAIEAHLKLQQQRICNLEQAAARGQLDPLVLNDPWTTTLNQAPMPPKLLAVKAPPPYLGQFTTPSPAENVKVDDAKPLPVKAPPPCLGQIASSMPAETVNMKVDDAKPLPVKAHPPLPLKAPPPVTVKVFAGTGPLTAVQVIEHAKQLPVKAPPEFPVKYPPPHPLTAIKE